MTSCNTSIALCRQWTLVNSFVAISATILKRNCASGSLQLNLIKCSPSGWHGSGSDGVEKRIKYWQSLGSLGSRRDSVSDWRGTVKEEHGQRFGQDQCWMDKKPEGKEGWGMPQRFQPLPCWAESEKHWFSMWKCLTKCFYQFISPRPFVLKRWRPLQIIRFLIKISLIMSTKGILTRRNWLPWQHYSSPFVTVLIESPYV